MKKVIVWSLMIVLFLGIMGYCGRKFINEPKTQTESFVAFQKDEIVTNREAD